MCRARSTTVIGALALSSATEGTLIGRGFSGASKTGMFLGSLQGWIHGGPENPRPMRVPGLNITASPFRALSSRPGTQHERDGSQPRECNAGNREDQRHCQDVV